MEKINVQVTVKGIYKYSKPSYNGFGYTDYRLYNMVAEDGTVYIWNTSSFFCEKFLDPENGWDIDSKGNKWNYSEINKNDVIEITASVKGQSEYKGQPQTELQRVKLVKRIVKAKTWDEIQAERKAEAEAKRTARLNPCRKVISSGQCRINSIRIIILIAKLLLDRLKEINTDAQLA